MPLCSVPTPQFPHDSPWAPGHPDPLFLPTPLVPRPPRCLIPPPTPTISDPQTPEDPLPLDGPQDPPRVAWVKTLVEDHPMADPREDGARRWTTFPPSTETEITTTTTTTPDPHLKLKIHRTIPATHWPGRESSTSRSPNPSPAATLGTKPITFQLESSQVAFTASYLQGIAFDHYTALLQFDPNNPILSNWLAFTQEFLSKFGVFDTVAEAEEYLFNLRMQAYKTGWNYNALRFALRHALPQRIKDVLCLTPKQTTYDGYKALITQVNQRYWEDRSENMAPRTSWNTSSNTNWQARATNGIQSSIPANPANPAPHFPPGRGVPNTNRPLGQCPPTQLNATDLHDTPVPLDTNPDDHDNIPDPADNQEALCANRIQDSPWIDVPEETQEKQWKEGTCILCGEQGHFIRSCPKRQVMGHAVWTIDGEDYCGPYPDVFSAPATLLCTMILAPDNPPAHLPSHSSTNLLLRTTLPFTDKPIPTLVDSGATNNFVDESLAALAPQPLRRLPAPIPLKLFDGDSTPAGDITHCLETTLTFADGQQQELQLLVTKLHPSAPIVLGFSWLRSTNPRVDWPSLTLCLDRDNPTDSGLVPFSVSPPSKNSETMIDQPQILPQLRSRSAQSFVIYVRLGSSLKILPALVDSGASSVFVSNQLDLRRNDLDKPLELQLFDGSPAMTRITQYHNNTLTLDNDLQFQARLLITQLPLSTPIVLGLPWLRDVNPNINWKNLTMQFPGPEASLAAAIHLHFQSIPDLDVTPDPTATPMVPNPINSGNLDIKIIGAVPFACLLQEGTPAFQLQVTPALPEEYLRTGTTTPKNKMEEQILSEVVPPEYHEFADVFSEGSAKELPPHCSYDHQIDLEEGTSPPLGKIYNMSEIELWTLKEYLDDMLGKGFIRPSISAAGAPVLFAKKKMDPSDSVWTIGDSTNAKIYTKIDLRSSYNNVWIAPGHEWKTAFRTRYSLFEYLIMPFGMTNSPATFQYFMNDIFHDMNNVFVIVYLDDILIYSNLPVEHSEHVRHVLERLQEYHLHTKPEKCSFHTVEVKYLGVIVTPNSVRMDPSKVDAILNWPSPRNIKEVQSFLGFANFYRCFIDNYSGITKPLNQLTRKDTPWDWDSKCQSVFLLLKKAFTSAPVLRHFNPSLLIVLECDASNYAITGILSQSNSGGKDLCPVAFYTQSMIPAELNYDIYDKELLMIIEAFRQWRAYLEGSLHRIQVYSNHNNLQYFTTMKQLSRRQAQWSKTLSEYDFTIHYRPGNRSKPNEMHSTIEWNPPANQEFTPRPLLQPAQPPQQPRQVERRQPLFAIPGPPPPAPEWTNLCPGPQVHLPRHTPAAPRSQTLGAPRNS
ncbi:hypothetical protein E4T56_gene18912 [Termitomyces sp. T112]|nr:hypothetical protein E4T56_gene18912 [Termitomyces sp. T112]